LTKNPSLLILSASDFGTTRLERPCGEIQPPFLVTTFGSSFTSLKVNQYVKRNTRVLCCSLQSSAVYCSVTWQSARRFGTTLSSGRLLMNCMLYSVHRLGYGLDDPVLKYRQEQQIFLFPNRPDQLCGPP